jgi:hypothetical protein
MARQGVTRPNAAVIPLEREWLAAGYGRGRS